MDTHDVPTAKALGKSAPATLRYEPGVILADKEYVIVHDRFSGHALSPRNWIAADIVRIADRVLTEHWDVLARQTNQGRVAERIADVRYNVQ